MSESTGAMESESVGMTSGGTASGATAAGGTAAGATTSGATAAGSRRWWALGAMCGALFMIMLDNTAVNVALPAISAACRPRR